MTYVFKRQLSKFSFPFIMQRKKLSKLIKLEDLGAFALDKVGIVTYPRMNTEDFPHDEKPQRYKSNEGYFHIFKFAGHSYYVYQGIGRVRVVFFPPREFQSLIHLKEYAKKIIGDRTYHITKVDFAFYLSKKYFSIDFLFFSLWAKGYTLSEVKKYSNPDHVALNKSYRQMFIVGKTLRRFICYDCDVHNLNKKRDEKKMVNDLINFEVGVRGRFLRKLGINVFEDLGELPLELLLDCVEFFNPSNTTFKNTTAEVLAQQWKEDGLQKFMRAIYSQWQDYEKITPKMSLLSISDRTLKKALIDLAKHEHALWIAGCSRPGRFGVQSAIYVMTKNPLFGF